jgi:cyclin-dependent kinase
MANGGPLFAGTSESDQLDRIFRHLGTPNEGVYPGIVELPEFQKVKVRGLALVGGVCG